MLSVLSGGQSLARPLNFQPFVAKFIGEAFKVERIQRAVNATRFSYFLDGSIPSRSNFTLRPKVTEIALGYSDIINKDVMTNCINQNFSEISFHSTVMPNILALVKPSDDILRQKSWRDSLCVMARTVKPYGDIALRLQWHRTLEGLEQKEYAEKAGLKRSQLSNWEAGNTRLSLDGALALRKTYGLSLDFMFEGIADALPMTLRSAWMERPEVSASK